MSIIDKLTKTKEEPKQYKVIQEFKQELNNYKTSISSLDRSQKEKLEGFFATGLIGIENNIKHLPDNIQNKFKTIVSNLSNPNIEVSGQDIDFIMEVLDSLAKESKEIESNFVVALEQNDLLALQESIKEVKSTKKQLSTLKHSISGNVNTEFPQLAKKAEKYVEQIKKFKTEHKYRTKALFLLIPKPILSVLFKNENTNNTDLESVKNIGEKLGIGNIGAILNQMKGFMTTLLTWVFDMPFIGAPKEMREFLHNIKKDFGTLSQEQLAQIKSMVKGGLNMDNFKKDGTEKLTSDIEQVRNSVITYLENKATDWFGITDENGKNNLNTVLSVWGKNWIKEGQQVSSDFLEKIKQGKEFEFTDILNGLGLGISASLDLLGKLYENNLISLKQIGFNILEKGGQIIISTALFFPKVLGINLGEGKLEDIFHYIEHTNLTEQNKQIFYVMLYRALNTGPFSILQHIAALPGYAISTLASAGQDITKGKLFLEAMKGNSIEYQLDFLEKMEKKLSGRNNGLYPEIKKAYTEYKKGIIVSYLYNKSNNLNEFKNLLKEVKLENDLKVKELLKNIGENFKTNNTAIASFINGLASDIKTIDKTIGKGLPETIKSTIGGVFGETNFFKNTISHLSTSLEHNASMFYKGEILNVYQRLKGRLKYAISTTDHLKMLDQAHLTGNVESLKDVAKDMQILARKAPDLLRGIFRNVPVIFMGKEFIDGVKEGKTEYTDILKIYTSFVPIVGPLVFISSQDKLNYVNIGTTAVWLGLDGWFIWTLKGEKNISKLGKLSKLAFGPVVDTMKFGGNVVDGLSRYISGGKLEIKKIPRNILGAAVVLLLMYAGYKFSQSDIKELEKDSSFKILSKLAQQKNGVEVVNNYLFNGDFANLDEDSQKALLLSVLATNLKLTPDMITKYFKDFEIDSSNKEIKIKFTETVKNSQYIQQQLSSYIPTFKLLLKKVGFSGYKLKVSYS